jgi:hypothetical protein
MRAEWLNGSKQMEFFSREMGLSLTTTRCDVCVYNENWLKEELMILVLTLHNGRGNYCPLCEKSPSYCYPRKRALCESLDARRTL